MQRTTKILQEKAGVWSGYLGTTLRAVQDFSVERVEAVYNEASSLYPVDMVTERLIEPVRARLGNDWQLRDAGIAEEHFYSHWVRNRLGARFHHASSQASGARILCACLPGSRHEIGLMLFTISALTRGYRVLYIGADLPLAEIPAVVSRSGTRGVVLSSRAGIDGAVEQQLADLAACVNAPVLLGGPCSDQPLRRFEQVPQRGLPQRGQIYLSLFSKCRASFATCQAMHSSDSENEVDCSSCFATSAVLPNRSPWSLPAPSWLPRLSTSRRSRVHPCPQTSRGRRRYVVVVAERHRSAGNAQRKPAVHLRCNMSCADRPANHRAAAGLGQR